MKKFIWIGLILFVAFIGCNLVDRDFSLAEDDFPDAGKGALVLILDGGALPTKTIAPILSMDVTTYELIFEGPDVLATTPDFSGSFTTTIGSSGLYVQSGFELGPNWTVEVNARNATPVVIGAIDGVPTTTEPFTITAGVSTPVTVDVLPIDGLGDLTLTLTWPDNAVASESITASLSTVDISAGFVITQGANDSAVYDTVPNGGLPQLDDGYYTLILQLYDDVALAWGWMEAVRIVTGQTTIYPWDLQLTAGGLLSLTTNMENPVDITFNPTAISSDLVYGPTGDGLSVIAETDPADPGGASAYAYQWYLDGSAVSDGTADATFTLAAGDALLTIGNHNLGVLVTTVGGTLSSNTIPFTVQ